MLLVEIGFMFFSIVVGGGIGIYIGSFVARKNNLEKIKSLTKKANCLKEEIKNIKE